MITSFGKFVRNIRMEKGHLLKDMAEKLNVSSAFLSGVENGKKEIPVDWQQKIVEIYELDDKQQEDLRKAINGTKNELKIDIRNLSTQDKDLAFSFARKLETFNELSEEEKKIMQKFISRR